MKSRRKGFRILRQSYSVPSHPCNRLENHGIVRCGCSILAPTKWPVASDQHCRNTHRVEAGKRPADGDAGVLFIIGRDFIIAQPFRHRDGSMEIIRMSRSQARNRASGLRPSSCELRMRVGDTADCREAFVEKEMSGQIGGWPKSSLDKASLQIGDNHVLRLQFLVRNAARFDHDEPCPAGYPAGVPECVKNQTAADQFEVRLQHFFAQRL